MPISAAALCLLSRHRAKSRSSRAQRVQGKASRIQPTEAGEAAGPSGVPTPTPRPRAPAAPGYLCESWSPPGDAPAGAQYGRLASLGRFSCTLSLFMPIWKPFMAWMAVCALAGLSKLTKPGETRGTRAWVSTGPPRRGGVSGEKVGSRRQGRGRGRADGGPSQRSRRASGQGRGSRLLPPGPAPGRPHAPLEPLCAWPLLGWALPRLQASPISPRLLAAPSPRGREPAAQWGSDRRPPPTPAGPGTSALSCGGRGRTHLRVEEFIGHCPP